MWGPAISGMGKSAYVRKPKLQAYPPIFSLTPKASGSTWLQSCEDIIHFFGFWNSIFIFSLAFFKKYLTYVSENTALCASWCRTCLELPFFYDGYFFYPFGVMDVERRWENWKSKRSMTRLWWSANSGSSVGIYTVHSVHSNVAKIHSRLPAAMEWILACMFRDSGVWTVVLLPVYKFFRI